MAELLPCPFCGEVPFLDKQPLWRTHGGTTHGYEGCYEYSITCKKCGCTLKYSHNNTIYNTDEEAILSVVSTWNSRVLNKGISNIVHCVDCVFKSEWIKNSLGEYFCRRSGLWNLSDNCFCHCGIKKPLERDD